MTEKTRSYENVCACINDTTRFARKNTLDNTRGILALMDIHMEKMHVIHVAGTNGKGSVCACLAAMLQEMGLETGLFISPHLVTMRERIMIDGRAVSKEMFVRAFEAVTDAADRWKKSGGESPTFFEILFLMAVQVFAWKKVSYAVFETGMGGRLDATNIFPAPSLCVITSIGLDHTRYLGRTIRAIAKEKAGIIKANIPIVFTDDGSEASEVIRERAGQLHAPVYSVSPKEVSGVRMTQKGIAFCYGMGYDEKEEWHVSLSGAYQAQNVSLALRAMRCLFGAGYAASWRRALTHVSWPGRFQEIVPGLIVDGAHNPPAMEAFVAAVRQRQQADAAKFRVVFAATSDKDCDGLVACLSELADIPGFLELIVTAYNDERSMTVRQLAGLFAARGFSVRTEPDIASALQAAGYGKTEDTGGRIYCTGSLYLVGEIMELFDWKTSGEDIC